MKHVAITITIYKYCGELLGYQFVICNTENLTTECKLGS